MIMIIQLNQVIAMTFYFVVFRFDYVEEKKTYTFAQHQK